MKTNEQQNPPSSKKKKSVIYVSGAQTGEASKSYHSYGPTEQKPRASSKPRRKSPRSSRSYMIQKSEAEDISDLLCYLQDWKYHGAKARNNDAEALMEFGKNELAINCLGFAPRGMYTLVKMGEVALEGKRFKNTPAEEYSIEDSDYSFHLRAFESDLDV